MASQSSLDQFHDEIGSPGIIGILVAIVVCAFLLGFIIGRFTHWIRRQQAPHVIAPTSSMGKESKEGRQLDLEAAVSESSYVIPELTINQPFTLSKVPKTKNASFSISLKTIRDFFTSLKFNANHPKRNSSEISRPTRILPTNARFVVVKSPLQSEHPMSTVTTPRLPLPSPILNHPTHTTDGQLTVSDKTLVDKNRNVGADEFGRKLSPGADPHVGTSSSQGARKRTITWYDDEVIPAQDKRSSVRSARSTSLPSSTTRSSWDLTPRVSESAGGRLPADWADARANFSASQLWLNYQTQLGG